MIGQNALIPNPALKPFEILIGEWQTTGTHPFLPNVELKGRTVFEWHERGAFLIMRSEIDHPQFPDGVEIFGSDDAVNTFYMLHFDERGTSRKFDVQINADGFSWQRTDPEFSQKLTLQVLEDGQRLETKGQMSRDGQNWEDDLSLVFTRLSASSE